MNKNIPAIVLFRRRYGEFIRNLYMCIYDSLVYPGFIIPHTFSWHHNNRFFKKLKLLLFHHTPDYEKDIISTYINFFINCLKTYLKKMK